MFNKIKNSVVLFLVLAASVAAQSGNMDQGIKLIKKDKLSEAKAFFSSLMNSPSKVQAAYYLGNIYMLEEKYDSAKAAYQAGIAADDESGLNYAGMVKVAVAQKNSADESKYVELAEDNADKNAAVYVALSEAYSNPKIKNYEKAIELLTTAKKMNNKTADLYVSLGNIYLAKGSGTEALKNYQDALDIDPKNSEAMTNKAKIYALINNTTEAVSLLEQAITNDPTWAQAYFELSEIYANQKDYAKAAEYYAQYLQNSEPTVEKEKRYASMLYLNKDYQKAIEVLNHVNQQQPDNATTVRMLAYSYLRLENTEASKEQFQKLFTIPNAEFLSTDYENYADLLGQTGNDSLALQYLQKVVELDSTRDDIFTKISIIYFKNKDWNGVINTLNRKTNLSAQELFDLGKAYLFAKDTVMADTTFGRLIAAKPDLGIGYIWRARIKAGFDPESEQGLAKPFYEKYIEIASTDTAKNRRDLIEAYSYLGYYYYLQKDISTSLATWEKVVALDPQNDVAKNAIEQLKKM